MPTTDTPINLVLNIMTAEKAQENIDQIPEKQLILTTNKNIPIPAASDVGKILKVNSSGEYVLGEGGGSASIAVVIEQPSSATSGTLPTGGLTILQASNENYILFANEIYRLNDKQTQSGYLVYSHVGEDNQGQFYLKCITITISTEGWVLSVLMPDAAPTIIKNTTDTTVSQQLANKTSYRYTQNLSSLTISFPTMTDNYESELVFKASNSGIIFSKGSAVIIWSGDDIFNNAFAPVVGKTYNILFWYDSINLNAVVRTDSDY